ncbi:hypothetical protein DEO23_10145 [Brachybacterium endophyticum]|uniref:DUF559 domain-containing protein n=2 Tax=Brachybacterium endophyticum TaxID=2182385 RepID=A0A2U2RK38_9MICO|nr:hypothetical protein DEO23_10145 [Brachybacterium endophyticum]
MAHGVRPTCVDAAALHGLWTPVVEGVHAFRLRVSTVPGPPPMLRPIRRVHDPVTGIPVAPRDSSPQWTSGMLQPLALHGPALRAWPDEDPVPNIRLTLDHAARCLPPVKAAILIESALHQHRMTSWQLEQLLAGLPTRTAGQLSRVRTDAQSGTETAVRWWFESRRVTVRSQAQLLPDARVDLLIGTNWVIECDSRRFHDDPQQYREDRRRDLALAARGYRVTRLTWEQVFLEWEKTEEMLLRILHRRQHLAGLPA